MVRTLSIFEARDGPHSILHSLLLKEGKEIKGGLIERDRPTPIIERSDFVIGLLLFNVLASLVCFSSRLHVQLSSLLCEMEKEHEVKLHSSVNVPLFSVPTRQLKYTIKSSFSYLLISLEK